MGLCSSTATQQRFEVLILGGGGCGKSTLFKQVKLYRQTLPPIPGLSRVGLEVERGVWSARIYLKLIDLCGKFARAKGAVAGLTPEQYEALCAFQYNSEETRSNMASVAACHGAFGAHVKASIADDAHQAYMQENKPLEVQEISPCIIFKNAERINTPGFEATDEDILQFRFPTTGIQEESVDVEDGFTVRFYDVGGQASERTNWKVAGERANCVIFVHALDDYHKTLSEDARKNRARESLMLFNLVTKRYFADKPVILMLNKADLFQREMEGDDKARALESFFSNFKAAAGEEKWSAGIDFFAKLFQEAYAACRDPAKPSGPNWSLQTMVTCATDQEQMTKVLDSILKIIRDMNLRASGFMTKAPASEVSARVMSAARAPM